MKNLAACVLLFSTLSVAQAQDLQPMDMEGLDPSMVEDMYGAWTIANEDGSKTCKVVLTKEGAIGGMAIDVDPACEKTFPVMGDVAAWWLAESWGIVMIDALRKTRLVFTTPDERYIARDEVDGIFTISKDE